MPKHNSIYFAKNLVKIKKEKCAIQNNLDKYGLVKVTNPNGKFLKNIILGLCMLFMAFGGFAFLSLLPKKGAEEVEAANAYLYNGSGTSSSNFTSYILSNLQTKTSNTSLTKTSISSITFTGTQPSGTN